MKIWISALLGGLMLIGSTATLMAQSSDDPQPDRIRPAWGTAKKDDNGKRGDRRTNRNNNRRRWGQDMTEKERKEWRERMQKMRNSMMLGRAISFALDTDQNGELSQTEIAKAVTSLKKFDTNKDGKLTVKELTKAIPEDMQWGRRGPDRGSRGPGERGDRRGPRGRGPGGPGPKDRPQPQKDVPIYRPID